MIYTNSLHQPSQTSFHLTMISPSPADRPADRHVSGQSCSCECATPDGGTSQCCLIAAICIKKSSLSTNLVKSEHIDTTYYIHFQCGSAFINLLRNHRKEMLIITSELASFLFIIKVIHWSISVGALQTIYSWCQFVKYVQMQGLSCSPQHNSLNPWQLFTSFSLNYLVFFAG